MKTCFHPRRLTLRDDHPSWSGILGPAGHRRKPCPSSKLSGAGREQSPEMICPWMKCSLSGLTRLLPGWGKGRVSCPLSLSATHPHFTDEETKGSERGGHLPEVTWLGRDKAGLHTKAGMCMREEEGERSNKGIPAPAPREIHLGWVKLWEACLPPRGNINAVTIIGKQTGGKHVICQNGQIQRVCIFVTVWFFNHFIDFSTSTPQYHNLP